jgi:hypothetical protein
LVPDAAAGRHREVDAVAHGRRRRIRGAEEGRRRILADILSSSWRRSNPAADARNSRAR